MTDDEMLEAVAAQYRRQFDERPPEWDAVAAGEMSASEAIARIRARTELDDVTAARAEAVFEPLDEDFEDQLADRLSEEVREELARSGPVRRVRPDDDAEPGGRVIARPPSFWRRSGVTVGIVAAAAATLVLIVRRPAPPPSDTPDAAAISLPGYELSVQPSAADVRATDTAGPTRLRPGHDVAILMRPSERHEHLARAAVCLERGDERRSLGVEQAPGAPGETLDVVAHLPADIAPGPWTLVGVVTAGPAADDPCTLPDGAAHRVMRAEVEIVASAETP